MTKNFFNKIVLQEKYNKFVVEQMDEDKSLEKYVHKTLESKFDEGLLDIFKKRITTNITESDSGEIEIKKTIIVCNRTLDEFRVIQRGIFHPEYLEEAQKLLRKKGYR